MITDEERREVALNLRYVSKHGGPEWDTAACCIAECMGEEDYPLFESTSMLFEKLADLIEPAPERTCRNISTIKGKFTCSECHQSWRHEYLANGEIAYCPSCGAKVIEE